MTADETSAVADTPTGVVPPVSASASAPVSLTNRFVAGRYDVLESLGEGVLIASYRARDRSLNRIVTLKTPLAAFTGREDIRERLRDGLGRVLGLSYGGIVRTYDVGEDASQSQGNQASLFYIIEEYVRGIDLKERIRRAAPFQLAAASEVAIAIAEALEYAQTRGVAHGDVRPQNVLVGAAVPGAEGGGIKLTGFGVARAQALAVGDDPAQTRRIVPYRAPEVSRDSAPTAAADIYALGVVLYELLTGELPYSGDNAFQIAVRHAEAPVPSASAANANVPPALDGIVRVAMQKRPEARYSSATEMLKDLRAVRDALRYGKSLTWEPTPRVAPVVLAVATVPVGETAVAAATDATVVAAVAAANESPVTTAPSAVPEPEPYDPYRNSAAVLASRAVVEPVISQRRPVAAVFAEPPLRGGAPLSSAASAASAVTAGPEEEEVPVNRGNREEEGGGGNRYLTSINLALSLLVVLAVGFLIWQVSTFFKASEDVVVPNLVGKTITDAKALAGEQKFELAVVDTQYRDNDPVDVIYQMNPAAGRHIREGKQVSIWVSKGPHMVPVPDLTGKSLDDARQVLASNNLREGSRTAEYDPFTPKGSVMRQTPEGGGMAPRGGKIDLVLSKGEEPVPTNDSPTPEPSADTATPAPDNATTTPAPSATPDADDSVSANKHRTFDVKYPVPADSQAHHVRIDVTDRDGTRTVLDESHKAGDSIHQRIEAVGRQIHIRLFDNDVLRSELTK